MRVMWCRFKFKPQDCWIGVYWRTSHLALADKLDVWICLLPMLPLHIWRFYNVRQPYQWQQSVEGEEEREGTRHGESAMGTG